MTPQQYAGRTPHVEILVTVFPAEGDKPAVADVQFRRDQWETFDAPVRLEAVPVSAWQGQAS